MSAEMIMGGLAIFAMLLAGAYLLGFLHGHADGHKCCAALSQPGKGE